MIGLEITAGSLSGQGGTLEQNMVFIGLLKTPGAPGCKVFYKSGMGPVRRSAIGLHQLARLGMGKEDNRRTGNAAYQVLQVTHAQNGRFLVHMAHGGVNEGF